MQNLINEMRSRGFDISHVIPDGRVHRFGDKKKSNWYICFQNHTRGGEELIVAQFGSWKTGEVFNWNSKAEMNADDRAFLKKQMETASQKAREEKENVQREVQIHSQQLWESLGDSEIPPYLIRKGIRGLYGARSHEQNLFVPCRDIDGVIWGLQRIQPDGGKYFTEGQRTSGTFFTFGSLEGAEKIYITEGFATGSSIYEALERPVLCSFNSGNIEPVCIEIRKKYPDAKIIICADNDLWTKNSKGEPYNPGRESAEKAAIKTGASVILPEFKSLETRPTDFNDLHLLEGIDAVRNQIAPVKGKRNFLVPLGFSEKEYFFTSTSNQQIIGLTGFSTSDFLHLMPMDYWELAFPGPKGGVNWSRATSELMSHCRAKGIFEQKRVRGSGVWLDDGRIVVNMGDHLLVNGSRVELGEIKSKYFYTLGVSLPELTAPPASIEQAKILVDICQNFRWQKSEYGPLIAGALVITKICGALPIRPHIWITGSSQTGKSTLLERLIRPTLDGFSVYFLGGSSEAGLRQRLKNDSRPVIFDEFETNGPKSNEHIQACVELMRSAWSESAGAIVKGGASGNATDYYARFSAIVSSIRTNLINDADRSRFTIVELAPHNNDADHWRKLDSLLNSYSQFHIDQIFARTLKMVPTILESYETFRKSLAGRVGARFGQQYGMLLAGYWSLVSDAAVTSEEASKFLSFFDLEDEKEEARLTDEMELLNFLKTKKLRVDTGEKSIGQLIDEAVHKMGPTSILEAHGIAAKGDSVFVASRHTELRALLKETKWQNCWSKTLARVPDAEKNISSRFLGIVLKSTKIPLSFFC